MRLNAEDWVQSVRTRFSDGVPNGWLLGWNRDRFFDELTKLVHPHACSNTTSFDYARCNKFEIQSSTERGSDLVLTVWISFILDVYGTHWTAYKKSGRNVYVVDGTQGRQASTLKATVRAFLEHKNFVDVPKEI